MAALEKDSLQQRKAFLDEACAGNTNLRQRIESLFESHGQAGNLLEHPALSAAGTVRPLQREISTDGAADGRGCSATSSEAISLDFLAPADDPQALGRLGPYTVTETIGRGGMGIVLKAHDPKLNRVVAIKVLAPELAANSTARKRFLREAQAAAAVVHQHVVTIHAVDDDRLPYLVMECIDGQSLQEKIDRAGHLELKEILRIGQQVAAGLAAAHASGLMHRDVKPANILLENGVQRVRITDFGLARAVDDVDMTKPGEVAGTPQYMSPEQAQGLPMDARSDLFSLGCVLYAMCTGRPPFRAETTLGIMRRVCEETPRSIREVNPDVPQWLVEIIDRLLAKQPTERFQSAQEVADLLGHYLAQVQNSRLAPRDEPQHGQSGGPQAYHAERDGNRRNVTATRGWVVGTAVLACLFAGLGFSEATGVTRLASVVIRIVTGEGTLIVESDDPAVKVTIEGDGGLVIGGAGPQEVRLRPGSYKVRADKDGQPLRPDRELVSIARGDKQIVRVRLEGETSPAARSAAAVAAAPEPQPFVILNNQGAAGRKFATLAEAVLKSSAGDTIEIRGNGPFATEPIKLSSRRTIRAGQGFRPVLTTEVIKPVSPGPPGCLLETHAPLVLEGLEIHGDADFLSSGRPEKLAINSWDAPLYVANCRFTWCNVTVQRPSDCQVRNSQFSPARHYAVLCMEGRSVILDNNIIATGAAAPLHLLRPENAQQMKFTRNVLTAGSAGAGSAGILVSLSTPRRGQTSGPTPLNLSHNIVSGPGGLLRFNLASYSPADSPPMPLQAAELEPMLRQQIAWHEEQNLYSTEAPLLSLSQGRTMAPVEPKQPLKTLAEWDQFWGQSDTGSIQGAARFQGGETVYSAPYTLGPDDFRLRSDSAGYRAGTNGKDLGPDIDLVGPGDAYERWKKTSAYDEWQRSIAQSFAAKPAVAVPAPQAQPFVILGRDGRAEQKLATLAEAVMKSSDGDTIEIRGNGPFVVEPIRLTSRRVIRAGTAFQPVLKINSPAVPTPNAPRYLESVAPLVLEGLEFQSADSDAWAAVTTLPQTGASQGALYVANCRFRRCQLMAQFVSACQIRNCEAYQPVLNAIGFFNNSAPLSALIDNTIAMTGANASVVSFGGNVTGQRLTLSRNFLVGRLGLNHPLPDEASEAAKPVPVESSQNIWFGSTGAVGFSVYSESPIPVEGTSATKLEALLQHVIVWRENRNLYPEKVGLLSLMRDKGVPIQPTRSYTTLTEWEQFWRVTPTDSIQGAIRCQGGDLIQKLMVAADKLTPQDFRLRENSAGYRAGAGGKDLGPDIDLVGPGAAYERWKKTPEYQEWLKETGQLQSYVAQAQAGAFVILGGSGIAERKFDTLADAVQKSREGDTIEIRGNGPFVMPQLEISTALTIRAGAGYRPVIQAAQGVESARPPSLVEAHRPLNLEGIEFQGPATSGSDCTFVVLDAPCYVANCQFRRCSLSVVRAPGYQLRNSHFSTARFSAGLVVSNAVPRSTQVVDNNVVTASLSVSGPGSQTEIRRNLVLGPQFSIAVAASNRTGEALPVGLHASQNILVGSPVLRFAETASVPLRTTAPSGAELETVIRSVINWQEDGNLYSEGARFFSLRYGTGPTPGGGFGFASVEPSRPYSTLSEWNEFWGQSNTGATQGRVQFQGGDAALTAPLTLGPDDFRLRSDSAGYRAGPEGKDLGPDIDLVGPGAAYERWKKTPEYQKWLEETGQKK